MNTGALPQKEVRISGYGAEESVNPAGTRGIKYVYIVKVKVTF